MKKIVLDKIGFIKTARHHSGWYVKVVPEGTNRYLILYTNGINRESTTEGYDDSVQKDDLEQYFEEAQLDVEWDRQE